MQQQMVLSLKACFTCLGAVLCARHECKSDRTIRRCSSHHLSPAGRASRERAVPARL
jgi:hypothetical protein